MSATDQALVTSGGVPVPQAYNPVDGRYEALPGDEDNGMYVQSAAGLPVRADASVAAYTAKTIAALSNTEQAVKSTAGLVVGVNVQNPNDDDVFLQWFDAVPANVTVGTTTPYAFQVVPAGGALDGPPCMPPGLGFSTAISVAATTTPTGAGAPATALPACVFYK